MLANYRKSLLVAVILFIAVCMIAPTMAATTQVQIVKYANDGTTILNQTTVNFTWMMNNLPVLGDGVTHYYHQGPVFLDDENNETHEQELRWNPEEDNNWDTKDMGAVKGTNLKDLCDLVGGMSPGEEVKILATDGWYKRFAYKNVYEYSTREGPIVICWYKDGMYPDSGYSEGMRMVWFAEATYKEGPTSIAGLPSGYYHVFGNWDWHEAADSKYWYYYRQGDEKYPTTTGLSGQVVNRIYIYSDDPVPTPPVAAFSSDTQTGTAPLTVQFTDQSTGTTPLTYAWDFDNDGTIDSTDQNPNHTYTSPGTYTVNLTVSNAVGCDSEVKTDYITVNAAPVAPIAAFSSDTQTGTAPLTVQFTDQSTGTTPLTYAWDFDNDGTIDSTDQNPNHTYTSPGTYTVNLTVSNAVGCDSEVKMDYITVTSPSSIDELFNGTVTLTEGETFTVTAYNTGGGTYTVNRTTPLGALDAASTLTGFTYDVTDKNYASSGALLLDNIGTYHYQKTPRKAWYAYVNGVYKDGYNNPAGALNLIGLNDGDTVEFYFVNGTVADPTNYAAVRAAASAAVKITVDISGSIPTEPDWTLALSGARTQTVTKTYFEQGLACPSSGHMVNYTDNEGNVWSGVPLWLLVAMVDDNPDTGPKHFNFNDTLATEGYLVNVTAGDGYSINFESAAIARNNGYIVANTINGHPLPLFKPNSTKLCFPLQMIGPAVSSGQLIGNITSIELVGLPEPPATEIPNITIIKYASDGTTIINQTTINHVWMEANLPVIGDGVTHYKYQGVTFDPADLWDPNETKGMNPPKIDNAIKGTRVRDLCDLVGGMAPGTEIKFVAKDGYETTMPYDVIYPNPHVYSHLGESVIAWYADGNYVPQYGDGPRFMFTPEDHVVGQWNMHEALPEQYWHYYWDGGVKYPSVAGTSAKYVATIKIYSAPVTDWSLILDGEAIGGLNQTIPRNYFESALACQFGANHKAEFTDNAGRTWSGMPLWFLCGFVDDADQHSDNAYNETKALDGYNITVIATDGYSVTFDSRDTIRSTNYIVANSLNGTPISENDPSWPLRLVGQNVTGSKIVKKVSMIKLEPIESQPHIGERTVYLSPSSMAVANGTNTEYEIRVSSLPEGLAGYDLVVTIADPSIAEIISVQYPAWAGLNNTTPSPPGDSLRLSSVDVNKNVQAGAENTLLATITVRADSTGTSEITLSDVHMDADGGDAITPDVISGDIVVHIPLTADFMANVTFGKASASRPLFVAFTDLSTGIPQASLWSWDFDNNGVADSILQNPVTSYTSPGNYTVSLTVQNDYSSDTEIKSEYIRITRFVKPFPGQTNDPTDPDGDFLYEDINGNGRLDYDDIVLYYENMQWIRDQTDVGIEPYDYNQNGRIDYDDVVTLYQELLAGHT